MKFAAIATVVLLAAVAIAAALGAAEEPPVPAEPSASAPTMSTPAATTAESEPAPPSDYSRWLPRADAAVTAVDAYAAAMDRCAARAAAGDVKQFLRCETKAYRALRRPAAGAVSAASAFAAADPGVPCARAAERYGARLTALTRVAQYVHISARLSSVSGVRQYISRLPGAAARYGAADADVRAHCAQG